MALEPPDAPPLTTGDRNALRINDRYETAGVAELKNHLRALGGMLDGMGRPVTPPFRQLAADLIVEVELRIRMLHRSASDTSTSTPNPVAPAATLPLPRESPDGDVRRHSSGRPGRPGRR